MDTKPLLYGLIGFFLGGLLVSVAATTFDQPTHAGSSMRQSLADTTGDAYDKAFLAGMIEHHEGAVQMSAQASSNAKHAEIKRLADDITTAQKREIEQMKTWQRQWGYGSAGASHGAHGN